MSTTNGVEQPVTRSEEDLTQIVAKTDSFWDIGNYKRVVKRIDDGARLCSDFVKMAQERADIEAKYVKNLQHWSRKWDDLVSKGPEYGTLEVGWKATLKEAVKLADIHVEIHRKIQDEIIESVQNWKSQNYHKSLMHLKETKKADDGFARAQKPWAKRLQKTQRTRKTFHQAARELEFQSNALQMSESNPDCTGEQCAKIRDKRDKAQKDLDKTLGKYKERLGDLQHYQSRYIEDMKIQFTKCQEFEQERMEFFKITLQNFKAAVDLSADARMVELYREYEETLSRVSAEDDLRWYSVKVGADMPYNWPEFEDYIPGQSMSRTSTVMAHNYSPSLNGGVHRRKSERSSMASSMASSNSDGPTSNTNTTRQNHDQEHGYESAEEWPEPPLPEEDRSDCNSVSSSEEPQGKLMRAIYDYSGSQDDDLGFKEGDLVRIMYEGKDGWAEGLMGEKYGYVPISYFESCSNTD